MSRRWRYPRNRRGEFFDFPKLVVAVTQQDTYPFIQQARRRAYLVQRGSYFTIPLPVPPNASPTPFITPSRPVTRRGYLPRRGELYLVPQAVPPVSPTPTVPRFGRRIGILPRRGEFLWVPPVAQQVAGPGPWIQPPYRQPGRRGFIARRGEYWIIPLAGLAPVSPPPPPDQVKARRRPNVAPPRRGRYTPPPAPRYDPPPTWSRCRVKPPRPIRRGHYYEPPWPPPAQPSVWRPDLIRARRRPIPRPRLLHCRFIEPGWPQAVAPPPGIVAYVEVVGGSTAGTAGASSSTGVVEADSTAGTVGAGSASGAVEGGTVTGGLPA